MSFLALRDLSKWYGNRAALRRVSFSIDSGELLAVVGNNGAGKSTLLRLIAGLERADQGSILVEGADFSSSQVFNNFRINQGIGYFSDKSMLYGDLSVEENLELFFCLSGRGNKQRFLELVDYLQIRDSYKKPIRSCSSGTIRRVSLVRALMGEPKLVVLDEPLAHLDDQSRKVVITLCREMLARDAAIVVATHEEELVNSCATHILKLSTDTTASFSALNGRTTTNNISVMN